MSGLFSDGRCMSNCSSLIGGGLGEDGAPLDFAQRLPDDRKRLPVLDVLFRRVI